MLTFTVEQMRVLQEKIGDPILLRQLRVHFAKFDPVWMGSAPEAEMDRRLIVGIARARRWDIQTFEGIGVFICGMQSAPRFDEHLAFRAVLSNPALDETGKIDGICAPGLLRHWRAARDIGLEWEG